MLANRFRPRLRSIDPLQMLSKPVQVTVGAWHSVFACAASLALVGRSEEGRTLARDLPGTKGLACDVWPDWVDARSLIWWRKAFAA